MDRRVSFSKDLSSSGTVSRVFRSVNLDVAIVLRANDLSGFVARDLSGFMLSLHRGMKHEADRAAPGDSADEIQRGVRRMACWGADPDGGGATAGDV